MSGQSSSKTAISRRSVLYGLGAFAGQSLLAGCGDATLANPLQPVPPGPLTQGSVAIAGSAGASIGASFTGLSYEKESLGAEPLFIGSNTGLIGMFKRLGTSLLRIGGNSVDQTVWTPDGPGRIPEQVAPADVDGLAAFLKATGWQCLYGVNLGGAATGATSPELAAAEVAYVARTLGSSLYAIEIGNECDLYGSTYYPSGWTLSQFEALWEQFRTAIVAAAPGVTISGPASGGSTSAWTVPFGEFATRQQLSLLTQHYYCGSSLDPTSTAANLVSVDPVLPYVCQNLQAAAQSIGVPWRMGETNSFSLGGVPGVSNSYASALWVIDHLATIALNGGSGVNLHGGGNTPGYTPIADNAGVVACARPMFYGLLLFTLFGQGELLTTNLSAAGLDVTAYSVQLSSGGINLLLVNKDSTQNLQANITCGQTIRQATLLQMSGPELAATSGVTIQGATINADGSFTPREAYVTPPIVAGMVTCYVPALSAVLLRLS